MWSLCMVARFFYVSWWFFPELGSFLKKFLIQLLMLLIFVTSNHFYVKQKKFRIRWKLTDHGTSMDSFFCDDVMKYFFPTSENLCPPYSTLTLFIISLKKVKDERINLFYFLNYNANLLMFFWKKKSILIFIGGKNVANSNQFRFELGTLEFSF